jgi:V-type H+-transporting ATPase subunit C
LPKQDAYFTATVAKIVETLRNLLNNDPSKLAQHVFVNGKPVDDYLLNYWTWNEGRYGTQRGLRDMTDVLVKARAPLFLAFLPRSVPSNYDHRR